MLAGRRKIRKDSLQNVTMIRRELIFEVRLMGHPLLKRNSNTERLPDGKGLARRAAAWTSRN